MLASAKILSSNACIANGESDRILDGTVGITVELDLADTPSSLGEKARR
jgi:hypothetical protein